MTQTAAQPITLAEINHLDREDFMSRLGGIFEHSPWIAEQAWEARPFASVDALHQAMVKAVQNAGHERQLALIGAHPELAGREAAEGTLTADSKGEQASAGLDRCTPEELAQLRELNRAYRDTFGFPFVMAVKHRSKQEILQALAARLRNPPEEEFRRCLDEIGKIARLRLAALLEGP